jgi:hypothetical protein
MHPSLGPASFVGGRFLPCPPAPLSEDTMLITLTLLINIMIMSLILCLSPRRRWTLR